jgi:predicted ArsR family transcriptional regulator
VIIGITGSASGNEVVSNSLKKKSVPERVGQRYRFVFMGAKAEIIKDEVTLYDCPKLSVVGEYEIICELELK